MRPISSYQIVDISIGLTEAVNYGTRYQILGEQFGSGGQCQQKGQKGLLGESLESFGLAELVNFSTRVQISEDHYVSR